MNLSEIEKAYATIKALRHPKTGCPWDVAQTHESLLPYLLEESYEYIDAVKRKNFKDMEEELGDVLLQIFLHSAIAEEGNGQFSLNSVAKKLNEKMIERHPHVFNPESSTVDNQANNEIKIEQIVNQWSDIKNKNKNLENELETFKTHIKKKILLQSPVAAAQKIGEKTASIRFDWENAQQVSYKVEEEWQELKEELMRNHQSNQKAIKEELGDLLFSVVQLARHLDINADDALQEANEKFLRRFWKMEELIYNDRHNIKKELKEMNQEEMDIYWNKVKQREKE